jgi:hypothetical protein
MKQPDSRATSKRSVSERVNLGIGRSLLRIWVTGKVHSSLVVVEGEAALLAG